MTIKKIEAEFNNKDYVSINNTLIEKLKKKCFLSPRGRYRFCLHDNTNHLTQEMIICFYGNQYVHPHKHLGSMSESYYIINGKVAVILFDNQGKVLDKIILSHKTKSGNENFMYRLSKPIYHTIVPLSKWTIYHEVTTGPFIKNKVVKYANFAPIETADNKTINYYLNNVGFKNYLK